MDNQKSNDGNARDLERDGAGSSMGKDMSQGEDMNKRADMGRGPDLNKSSEMSTHLELNTGADLQRGASSSAGSDLSRSAENMHKTIDKAAQAAQPIVDRLTSSAHAGVDKLSGALAGASGQMDDKKRQLAQAYGHFAENGREYVRSSPGTSVLIAVGAGWLLSKLLGGRR